MRQETRRKKKSKLISDKAGIEEKIREIKDRGCGWLGPFEEFVNCANQAQKIAHTKNNGHELKVMAKTVGSDFLLLDKTIWPKYKNAAITALAAHAPAACATSGDSSISTLLAHWNYFRVSCVI